MEFPKKPLADFVDMLRAGTPFTFSRWGDGEWHSVFGRSTGFNCDLHHYFPQMGKELRNVLLERPPYILGMQPLAISMFKGRIESWLSANRLHDLDWINADVFHNASEAGALGPLFEVLHTRQLVFAANDQVLAALSQLFRSHVNGLARVPVPTKDSYLAVTDITRMLQTILDDCPSSPGPVVGLSLGMPAKIVADQLYRSHSHATIIDFGSLWDYYAGKLSRKYMRRMPPPPDLTKEESS